MERKKTVNLSEMNGHGDNTGKRFNILSIKTTRIYVTILMW